MAEASSAPAISHRVQRECARARVLASWRSTFRRLWRDTMTVPFAAQGEAFNGFILAELASLAAAAPGDRLDPLLPLGGDGAAGARVLESYAHLQIGPLSKDKAESNLARLVGSYASFLRGRGVQRCCLRGHAHRRTLPAAQAGPTVLGRVGLRAERPVHGRTVLCHELDLLAEHIHALLAEKGQMLGFS